MLYSAFSVEVSRFLLLFVPLVMTFAFGFFALRNAVGWNDFFSVAGLAAFPTLVQPEPTTGALDAQPDIASDLGASVAYLAV